MASFDSQSFDTSSFSNVAFFFDAVAIATTPKKDLSSVSGGEDLRKYLYYDNIEYKEPNTYYEQALKEDAELIEVITALVMSKII